ncbi:MAG: phosphohydrolase [Kordia sp.]|nr:MAG: phosphohydrolase [Kordia sp.]
MDSLLKDIKEYVFSLLQDELPAHIIYHNFPHTLRVVVKLQELIKGEQVSDQEAELLQIAAWFHDAGFVKGAENHEESGVQLAKNFLIGKISDDDFAIVERLILATKIRTKPINQLERIIKDADCSHLASKSFNQTSDLLKEELRLTNTADHSDLDWKKENITFLTSHQFYTNYAIENWQEKKQTNLLALFKAVKKLEKERKVAKQKKKALKEKERKAELPEKGVETMFRVVLRNHNKLSQIADTKANILLSVNAILISIALSSLVPRLDNPSNAHLIIPTVILISFSVVSIIFAIQSTRPKVTEGQFTKEDVAQKKVNLLFFGNFHQMKLDDFTWGMKEVMKDKDYLYDSMIKDLYFLGLVLNRKYKLLRTTYTVFTIGIVVSVLSFFLAFFSLGK